MSSLQYIIVIVIIIILAFSILNSIQLYSLKKSQKKGESPLSDEKFFQLKFQIQSYVTVASIVISVFIFFGYKSLEDIKIDIDKGLSSYNESLLKLDSLKSKVDPLDSLLNNYIYFTKNFEFEKKSISEFVEKEKIKAKGVNYHISNLEMLYEENPRIYICSYSPRSGSTIFYNDSIEVSETSIPFNKVRTLDGKLLPKFTTVPKLVLIEGGCEKHVTHISKYNFTVRSTCDKLYFSSSGDINFIILEKRIN